MRTTKMKANNLYNKFILIPLSLFASTLVAYWFGYLLPIPRQLADLDYNPQSGLGGALASTIFFGVIFTTLKIIYAINILYRGCSTTFISILGSSYPISMYAIMLANIMLAFGLGLYHSGPSGFKLYLANFCSGLFLYFSFCGFIFLAIDGAAYLVRRGAQRR